MICRHTLVTLVVSKAALFMCHPENLMVLREDKTCYLDLKVSIKSSVI